MVDPPSQAERQSRSPEKPRPIRVSTQCGACAVALLVLDHAKRAEADHRWSQMQWRWQTVHAPEIVAAAHIAKMHRPLKADQLLHADAAIKVDQVGAATEQDVLTIVQFLAALRIVKRTGPSTQRAASLEQRDLRPGGFERDRRRHTRQAAADDEYATHFALTAFQPIRSLDQSESDTRSVSTRRGFRAILFSRPR